MHRGQVALTCGALMLLAVNAAAAQHEHHHMDEAAAPMNGVLGIPMDRMASGTTWIPDAVSLPMRHFRAGSWTVMAHGVVFGQYDVQGGGGGPRGASQLGSVNWAMIMADHDLAGGRFELRFMPSLDPLTVGQCGYPLLLQTGERCNGQPLVDRQHPHDFFIELGALYEHAINSRTALLLYAAPAGEPALGPVAAMHRPSAMDEPQIPLGHHWQDVTHISFGVVTAGVFTRTVRVEASVFNGREPDENRWDLDFAPLRSLSGRVTLNANANWSLSAGYGYLDNVERSMPGESLHRLVVSAMHGVRLSQVAQWATTALYGANSRPGLGWSSTGLLESEAVLDRAHTVFGRLELAQKSAADLQIASAPPDRLFTIEAASLGYVRELTRLFGLSVGLGARATINFVPSALETTYGSRTPAGGSAFLRLRVASPR